MALTLSSAQILRNPPKDYRPEGWKPSAKNITINVDVEPFEMIKTLKFIMLWISYWFGTTAGLMIISQLKQVAIELSGIESNQASLLVSLLGAFNALGRIFWGFVGDKISREKALTLTFLTCLIALLMVSDAYFIQSVFTLGVLLIGLCFGGF